MNPVNWEAGRIREENAIEYEHRPKVVPFPTRQTKVDAAYSAQLLEEDREATRREQRRAEIRQLIERYEMENAWDVLDIQHRNDLIETLRIEDQLLEAPKHG